ncbi:hypothetical protein H9657_09525 [Cellulomonas sp. Sa3CUA2]|uniref:Lipoprotein n=1 Tax=Cellulomonas avistercoris TaxID=2762242 RepID=A0ABR8QDL3_9CELL|nr:hypothetical protein [Cellulomonas avistercoris]MBD7918515.1 hypothetical protein [Cellulomonas avistercoris]
MSSTTTRGRGTARAVTTGVTLAAVLLAAGCGTGDERTPPAATTTAAAPSADATSAGADDPASVLTSYGLALPAGAADAQAEPRTDDTMTDAWLVTFSAPADEVEAMCVDAGIGAPRVSLSLTADELAAYGLDAVPQDAWACEASRPSDMRQQIRVLFDGEPATVRVALYTMPER